jgi:D-hexose-6-phosphate mutarotase
VLVSVSFLENTSDLYAGNLLELFREDAKISEWLSKEWQSEELQHGAALRGYVPQVWPPFCQGCCRDGLTELLRANGSMKREEAT